MEAIAGNKYDVEFLLNETELRRIISLIKEQFLKLDIDCQITETYEIIYKNGRIAKNLTLDKILGEENYGSGKIINLVSILKVDSIDTKDDSEVEKVVKLEFHNLDESELVSSHYSVAYTVKGTSRDWVFNTSSMLDERVQKVSKENKLVGFVSTFPTFSFGFLWGMLVLTIFGLLINEVSIENYHVLEPKLEGNIIAELEELADSNSFQSPIEAIIAIKLIEEKQKTKQEDMLDSWKKERQKWYEGELMNKNSNRWSRFPWYLKVLFIYVLPVFIYYTLRKVCIKYYSCYNFLWGEYEVEYNKNKKTFDFIVNGIIIGIVVSFIGGILANLL